MSDIVQIEDQYYVLATSILADRESRVLKHGDSFAVFDPFGDVGSFTHPESGIFFRGTRHLSKFKMRIFGQRPLLLNSTLRDDNGLLKVDMTTQDIPTQDTTGLLKKGTIFIQREKFLLEDHCQEKVEIANFGNSDIEINLHFEFDADFADIFEVRGSQRRKRGKINSTERHGNEIKFSYDGLDDIQRSTRFTITNTKFDLFENKIVITVKVPAQGTENFCLSVAFHQDHKPRPHLQYVQGLEAVKHVHYSGRKSYCKIRTSNDQFDLWLRRSTDDLVMLTTKTEQGFSYPYAGIPWYCTPFGRDGIVTALQCLWANPLLAKDTLEYLAATQATEHIAEHDATPGKIIHEVRHGEMPNLKVVPFGSYYGSVDSTPLFLCLGGQYFLRTADIEIVKRLWPSFEKAILWINRFGDLDGDGFVEYQRENPNGLVQQGWKDSHDSIFHEDGSDAIGPIALCEVQAYVYMAKLEGARLADVVGHSDLAANLRREAALLKEKFDESFWIDDLKTYALALDGQKKPCRVRSSNAGQCLFTEIVKEERAADLVKTLMSDDSFSGWGIRTISAHQSRYNPMSYHNGSVWPHDISLIAWGLSKYDYQEEVELLCNGLFKSATYMESYRLPEVYCGFRRKEGEAPTLYPHACSPQAWAAGSVYLMVQALLGLTIDHVEKKVCFKSPRLLPSIDLLKVEHLITQSNYFNLVIQKFESDVSVQLEHRDPEFSVIVAK